VCLSAQQPEKITSLKALHAISNATAARSIPVSFEGSVTYYEKGNVDLFVQDGDAAIYVEAAPDLTVRTGDRVLVEGITRASFRPEILGKTVTVLRHGQPPAPVEAQFSQMIRGDLDCRRATVRGVVRAANVISDGSGKSVLLDMVMPGGPLQAQVADRDITTDRLPLLDSTIEITGAVAGKFDRKNQMTGILLEVPSMADLRILEPARYSPAQLPTRAFDEILHTVRIDDQSARVRVQGTITYYQPGAGLVLQDGSNALWADTRSEEPHRVGDHAFVSGFADVRNGAVVLTKATIESTRPDAPMSVARLDAAQLVAGAHAFELVSVEGQLVMRVREAAQDQYVIASQGHVFSAIYRHPERGLNLPVSPLRDVRLGSRVRITGICVLDRGDQFRGPAAFHMLLRSSEDIAVLAGPSLISVRNLGILLVILLVVVFAMIGTAFLLERKLRTQTAATAATVERWRTRVIDGINKAIPLRETLTQITELLTFKLQSDYCWVEVDLEGTFGECPGVSERSALDLIEQPIPSHSGGALGKVCAAFRTQHGKRRAGPEDFQNAVRLAALAIETGGRYSDLVRRSEFDALTNARNRFAFERALDLAVERGAGSGGKFGVIFVDLDKFKQVNDKFGHHIGDRYLQETVARLSHHLRAKDILARIGGDEFAVLITHLSGAAEVYEIGTRLQSCFDSPFSLEEAEIRGTASVGCAVYPDDETTAAALLQCADGRMYKQKKTGDGRIIHSPRSAV
jgi:diguanylate cyclase (GGDEF)-like protein